MPEPVTAMVAGYLAAADCIERQLGAPTGALLDVGCNTGDGLAALKTRWPRTACFGIEPVAALAHRARERGLPVATASAERIPHSDESMDVIFTRHAIEHFADREAALAEFARVLVPGGAIYVQAPIEPMGSPNALHTSPFFSVEDFRETLTRYFDEVYFGPQPTVAEFIGLNPANGLGGRCLACAAQAVRRGHPPGGDHV